MALDLGEQASYLQGVWIAAPPHSPVLTSATTIFQALDFLHSQGFNAVFPAVWNRGYTAFPSATLARYGFPQHNPLFNGFDPLPVLVEGGKQRGIKVIPWFEYGFAASADPDGGHLLRKSPHWAALDPQGHWVRHGGLTWMNGLHPEVQEFMLALLLEVLETYGVDGIQGCDRLPALPVCGGYDAFTRALYREHTQQDPPAQLTDPLWVKFRGDRLTEYLQRIYHTLKQTHPQAVIAMAPAPFPFGRDHLLQDTEAWLDQNLVDWLSPQLYRSDFRAYKTEIDRLARRWPPGTLKKIAPGLAFKANQQVLSSQTVAQCVNYTQNQGLGGQVFFFFEGLKFHFDLQESMT